MSVIVRDRFEGKEVFLRHDFVRPLDEDDPPRAKQNFIYPASKAEREYLESVFESGVTRYRFSAHDGNYELYYPYFEGDRRIVLYFTDFQQYGKLGS